MRKLTIAIVSVLCLILIVPAGGLPVPVLDLDELTENADLVVSGRVTRIQDVGRDTIEAVGGQQYRLLSSLERCSQTPRSRGGVFREYPSRTGGQMRPSAMGVSSRQSTVFTF